MVLGLFAPPVLATFMIFMSKDANIIKDFKQKLIRFHKINPNNILLAVLLFGSIVIISITASLLFGESITQFSFTDGFSFSISGSSALLTILLASTVEEIGWRGYGEDAIAQYFDWFWESIIFGFVWSLWHIPLFFIEGTYQHNLYMLGPIYVFNFLFSVIPMGFITTWVYLKNNRSLLSNIIFHLFVNFLQEKVAMTPQTKCLESIVVLIFASVIVYKNKELFFEKEHIGKMPYDYADKKLIYEQH